MHASPPPPPPDTHTGTLSLSQVRSGRLALLHADRTIRRVADDERNPLAPKSPRAKDGRRGGKDDGSSSSSSSSSHRSNKGSSGSGGGSSSSSFGTGRGGAATEDELLASLAGELQGMVTMPGAVPERCGQVPTEGDALRALLGPGDTLGVGIMRPLDAAAAAAVAKGGDAAAAAKSSVPGGASGRGDAGDSDWQSDGSLLLRDTVVAVTRAEVRLFSSSSSSSSSL